MKILFHIPVYFDAQQSGGEATAKDYVEYLTSKGHEVKVLVFKRKAVKYNNIDIHLDKEICIKLYQWCDVVFTHLGMQGKAWNLSKHTNKPLILYMHNTNSSAVAKAHREVSVIYNSYFTHRNVSKQFIKNNSTILRPILKADCSQFMNGVNVTLININKNKGGFILQEIAETMPDVKFLGVKGGYSDQVIAQPPNVEVVENTNNITDIYKKTKVLIMPSLYESYGRTAVEAICHGIPVIYYKHAGGLIEAVGDAGIPITDRNNINAWCKSIETVFTNIDFYRKYTMDQAQRLQRQMRRDSDNLDSFIKGVTFENKSS